MNRPLNLALGVRPRTILVFATLVGCGGPPGPESDIAATVSALVLTDCSGAAVSAAVAAGGDVVLSCGPNPVTITMPPTSVTHSGRLSATTGMVTITHLSSLFEVSNNASFEVDNIRFVAGSSSSRAAHIIPGSATFLGCSFSGYTGLALVVQTAASHLTVVSSTFTSNGNGGSNFAAPIYSEGSFTTVSNSTFNGNFSVGSGGAIGAFGGQLTVSGSTFANNQAQIGAAIYMAGGVHSITNSTFFLNRATVGGGAVAAVNGATTTVSYSTFSHSGSPTGTFAGNPVLMNSILLDQASPAGVSCALGGFGNIEWPTTLALCGAGFRYGNPMLGTLASNGGPTMTLALNPGSAAIDTAAGACPASDQRGVARPRDGAGNGSAICDVGAYER
jgi:hypothetical protein